MKTGWLLLLSIFMALNAAGQTMADFKDWPKGRVSIKVDVRFGIKYLDDTVVSLSGKPVDSDKYHGRGPRVVRYGYKQLKWRLPLLFENINWPASIRANEGGHVWPSIYLNNIIEGAYVRIRKDTVGYVSVDNCVIPHFYISDSKLVFAKFDEVKLDNLFIEKDSIAGLICLNDSIDYLILTENRIRSMYINRFALKKDNNIVTKGRIENIQSSNSTYVDTVSLQGNDTVLLFSSNNDKIGSLRFDSTTVSKLFFANCGITWLALNGCTITDSLSLAGSHLEKGGVITGTLKGPLNLQGLEIGPNAELDLRQLFGHVLKGGERQRIPVNLFKAPIDKLHLDWSHFTVDWRAEALPATVRKTYQDLLTNFKNHNQDEDYRLVDIEAQEFNNQHLFHAWHLRWLGYVWDWLVWAWWYYGYHRWQPAIWTLLLPFLIAVTLRHRNVQRMQQEVYEVDNFSELEKQTSKPSAWQRYTRKLVYASVVFFALSVKFEKLHYTNGKLLARFILIYLLGIWCLFFIVNFLLKA